MFFGLNEFWLISGQRDSTTVVPTQDLIDLPISPCFTGGNTTSKTGTKAAALKTASKSGFERYELFCFCFGLFFLGQTEITDEKIGNAENFLFK